MFPDLDKNYWTNRYQNKDFGWDIGSISEPLKAYIDQLTDFSKKILIAGAGNAYEAEYLFKKGFQNVFVADISPIPLQNFAERNPDFPKNQLLEIDFFEIDQQFDLFLEQTFFCAINPNLRKKYAQKVAELLTDKGKLAGVFFDTVFDSPNPPYGGSEAEYRAYFEPYFHFKHFSTCHNSIKPRANRELFACLEKI